MSDDTCFECGEDLGDVWYFTLGDRMDWRVCDDCYGETADDDDEEYEDDDDDE